MRAYRLTSTFDDEEPDYVPPLFPDEDDPPLRTAARTVSRRVSTKQSPHFKAFYKHHPLRLTLDTGVETSMIKSSVARSIGATIVKSSQQALQADGMTPLAVAGETHLTLSRADKQLGLDALVVDDLDVDVLAGTPFLISNDITVRPALSQVRIQDSDVIHYNPDSDSTGSHAVRRAQSLHPLDGPRAVIRVDPAPGFSSLSNNDSLGHLNVSIDVGHIKNKNHNPVAKKAVRELEEELLRQQPGGGPVGEVGLALATARLNSRLRFLGLSSLELWTQRNQFTHEQLPLSDYQLILDRHKHRSTNHAYSEKSKNPRGLIANTPPLQVGDIVYLFSDKDKSRTRDRYVVVSIDTPWCFVKKFRGSQLRATSYKVKLSECYSVPSSVIVSSPPSHPTLPDMNDEPPVTPAVFPAPVHPMLAPPAPPELITIPSDEEQVPSFSSDDPPFNTTSSSPAPVAVQDESSTSVAATDQPMLSPPNFPSLPDARPQRQRRPPSYLQDYVRF